MGKTAKEVRRPLFAGVLVLLSIALLAAGTVVVRRSLLLHRQKWQQARKEAFVKADKVSLYNDIRLLEEKKRLNIANLIPSASQHTNVNALLVHLFAEAHMYVSVPVSNLAGSGMFVDPWGLPYKFTVATNAQVPGAFGRHIEGRIMIERGAAH